MKNKLFYFLLTITCVILLIITFSCFINDETEDRARDSDRELQNNQSTFLYNVIKPEPSAEISEEYSKAINTFSVNLLREIYKQSDFNGENLIVSPFSVSRVLSVITEGTVNESKQELLNILGGQKTLDDAKSALQELLYADSSVIFQSADALFFNQKEYSINTIFKNTVIQKYGVDIRGADFSDAQNTANNINSWVHQNTANFIDKIIDPKEFTSDLIAIILNAVYFKADWESPFDITLTKKDDFYSPKGIIKVDMMSSKYEHKIAKTDIYENVCIYYGNDNKQYFYLDIYLPTDVTIDNFVQNYSLKSLTEEKNYNYGGLIMPKFDFESEIDLKEVLQEMEVSGIFEPSKGEITGIFETSNIYISKIKQKAAIKTDEEGTEVAAVTIAVLSPSPFSEIEIKLDRPFVYYIRAGQKGLVLFAGVVTNP